MGQHCGGELGAEDWSLTFLLFYGWGGEIGAGDWSLTMTLLHRWEGEMFSQCHKTIMGEE